MSELEAFAAHHERPPFVCHTRPLLLPFSLKSCFLGEVVLLPLAEDDDEGAVGPLPGLGLARGDWGERDSCVCAVSNSKSSFEQ